MCDPWLRAKSTRNDGRSPAAGRIRRRGILRGAGVYGTPPPPPDAKEGAMRESNSANSVYSV